MRARFAERWWWGYVLGVVAVAMGFLLRLAISSAIGTRGGELPTYITFYPAVMVVAVLAGARAGLFATALVLGLTWYWIVPPKGSLMVERPADLVGLGLFAAMGTFMSVVAALYRRARMRVAADEELKESRAQNEFLANLIKASSQPVGVGYPDGRLGLINQAFEELTGYTADELHRLDWAEALTPPEWRGAEREKLAELHRTGQPVRYEKEYIRKDGRRVPIELLVHLAKDAQGQPQYYYSFLTDITERKRAHEALSQSNEELQAANEELQAAEEELTAQNQSMLEAQEKLSRLNRTLRALSHSNRAMIAATDEAQYVEVACRVVVEDCGHLMAWVGYAQDDAQKTVRPVAQAGIEEGYLQTAQITWADTQRGRGPTGTAIRTGRVSVCHDMLTDERLAPWRDQATKRGYASSIALPLMADGKAFGALTIYSCEPRPFVAEEVALLEELAGDLASGINALRLRAAAQAAEAEARQSRAKLDDARARLAAIVETSEDAILSKSLDGTILSWNASAERMFGYWAEEIVGQPMTLLVPPELVEEEKGILDRLSRGESIAHWETVRIAKDGRRLDVSLTVSLLRDAAGNVIGASKILRDITDRKQAEQELREREERLRLLIEHAPASLAMFDRDMRYLSVSRRWLSDYGLEGQNLLGRSHYDVFPEVPQRWRELHRRGLAGEVVRADEDPFERLDGTRQWLRWEIHPWRDAAGRVAGIVIFTEDITQRKQAQQSLEAAMVSAEQAKARAEEASKAKDHFLAVLSHELRTPLTPVLTTANLLAQDSELPERYRDDVQMIWRNVELEARLIDDLLDVTRITRGKVELDKRPVELCEVIRRAVEVCKPDIEARRLEFGVDTGPDGPYMVHADATRLQQVFWNLLKNAIKFTPHGGCVGIRCRRHDGHVIAEVNDSGQGITPKVLPRLFNAFEQGERSITRQFGGLGLGLTITKGLVEMHGGSIEAHSEGLGKGATFTVKLPLAEVASPVDETGSPAGLQHISRTQSRKLRILVVEDHGDTARIMKRLLEMDGHQVRTAGDVVTALELVGGETFDLLISDLGLPDGSGVELMRQLREGGSKVPGIALSGYGQEEDIRRSKAAGFAAHLTKPTSPERLAQTIASVTATSR